MFTWSRAEATRGALMGGTGPEREELTGGTGPEREELTGGTGPEREELAGGTGPERGAAGGRVLGAAAARRFWFISARA